MADVRPAGNGARAHRDHQLRRRHGFISLAQRQGHVLRDRAGDEQAVGMAGRRDELDAEPAQVEDHGVQHVHVGFAPVAAAGADLPQLEGAAEYPARLVVEGFGQLIFLFAEDQRVAMGGGEAIFRRETDGAGGTRAVRTRGQNRQRPRSICTPLASTLDSVRRTDVGANGATGRAFRGIDFRAAAKPVGQHGRSRRERDGAVFLLGAGEQDF